jgi:hypothetical protein
MFFVFTFPILLLFFPGLVLIIDFLIFFLALFLSLFIDFFLLAFFRGDILMPLAR